jgi:hypothetical protein
MIDSDIVTSLVLQTDGDEHVIYKEVESEYADVAGTLLEKNVGVMCVIGHDSEKTMPVVLARKARLLSDRKDGDDVYFGDLEKDILDLLSVYLYCGVVVVHGSRIEEFLRWAEMWKIPGFVS